MNRRRLTALAASILSAMIIVPSSFVGAENRKPVQSKVYVESRGQHVRSYAASTPGRRPEWVNSATERSLNHLEKQGYARGQFALRTVDQDNLATHIRLDQYLNGVPVFGGQAVVHLDPNGNVLQTDGFVYDVGPDTNAKLSEADALDVALNELGRAPVRGTPNGYEETTRLVIFPTSEKEAVLAYQVSVHIEDGSDATAHHEVFVNAQDASVVYYYNDLDTSDAAGTGNSLYSGQVAIRGDYTSGTYYLRDLTRGNMDTIDMRNRTSGGYYFTDADNVWGNSTTSSTQSAAVDAHFGAAQTWDYYLGTFGRRGIDGNGFAVRSRVHYGRNYNNAFWNGSVMTYGDGDGSTFSSLVSLDVAGHEITHGLTEKTAGLIYTKESGASNEAFSDIFGTMVEFYTYGAGGNYEIGEDIYTPSKAGDALRSMSNPGLYGDPDHYSKRLYPEPCSPSQTNDNCGVHSNSGIVNQAFYLLAEGGTNRTSGLSVTGIGRGKAAAIFYRSLTVYLSPSSNFSALRAANLNSARDLYGSGSPEYNAVISAWNAVGVY